VPDAVQRTYHPLEVDLAATGRAEIPPAAAVAEIEMPAEDAAVARRVRPPRVLHVHMADARREALDERYVVNALIAEVARVEVEAECRVPVHGIERALRGHQVERDLGRVDLQREGHLDFGKGVEDRCPATAEISEPFLDHLRRHGPLPSGRSVPPAPRATPAYTAR